MNGIPEQSITVLIPDCVRMCVYVKVRKKIKIKKLKKFTKSIDNICVYDIMVL